MCFSTDGSSASLRGRAALVFPSFWVFYEFLSERTSPHSTFGNLAYSQMNFLPVLQVTSITVLGAVDPWAETTRTVTKYRSMKLR